MYLNSLFDRAQTMPEASPRRTVDETSTVRRNKTEEASLDQGAREKKKKKKKKEGPARSASKPEGKKSHKDEARRSEQVAARRPSDTMLDLPAVELGLPRESKGSGRKGPPRINVDAACVKVDAAMPAPPSPLVAPWNRPQQAKSPPADAQDAVEEGEEPGDSWVSMFIVRTRNTADFGGRESLRDQSPEAAPSGKRQSPSFTDDGTFECNYATEAQKSRAKRVAALAGYDLKDPGNIAFSDDLKKKALQYASMGSRALGAPVVPRTVMRLPRFQREDDRSPLAHPYDAVQKELTAQRVLGGYAGTLALSRWYVPYLLLAAVYLPIVWLFCGDQEALLMSTPLLVFMLALHFARLAWWDFRLLTAVDAAVAVDVRKQLETPAPLGWGDKYATFAANLETALRALAPDSEHCHTKKAGGRRLLLSFTRAQYLASSRSFLVLALVLLCAWPVAKAVPLDMASQGLLAVLVVVISIFVGFAPMKSQSRVLEANLRLEALEAALGAMLDVLRPLIGSRSSQSETGTLPEEQPLLATGSHFSVRLVTESRRTLRATLRLPPGGGTPIQVSCPLAGFSIVANVVQGATPDYLGKTAAGGADLPDVRARRTGLLSGLHRFGRQLVSQPNDDAMSQSVYSSSTASTMRSCGDGGDPEAALKLAIAMAQAMFTPRPLEAFRVGNGSAILPPKGVEDEPCLTLLFSADTLRLVSFLGPCQLARRRRALAAAIGKCCPTEDRLGVLRGAADAHNLRRAHAKTQDLGDLDALCDTPRSSCASLGSAPSESRRGSSGSSRSARPVKDQLDTMQHLVLLFDTLSERDRCLEALRETSIQVKVEAVPER